MRFLNFLARFFIHNQTVISATADVAAGVAAVTTIIGTGDANMLTQAVMTATAGVVGPEWTPLIAIGAGYLAGAVSGAKTKATAPAK